MNIEHNSLILWQRRSAIRGCGWLFFEGDFLSVEGYGSRAHGDSGVKAGALRFNLRGRPGLSLKKQH